MISKEQKMRLGFFLIIGFSTVTFIILLLLGTRINNRMDTYRIVFEDTSVLGVQVNSAVLYRGIRVGRIDSIEIDRDNINNIIIFVSIQRGTPIKADQEAVFVMVGVTGLRQIEIRGGTNESQFLNPGDTILAGKSFFENVSDISETLVSRLEQLLDNLNAITNRSNQIRFDDILMNVDGILSDVRIPIVESLNSINRLTNDLSVSTAHFTENVENILSNFDKISSDLASIDFGFMIEQLTISINKAYDLMDSLDTLVSTNSPDVSLLMQEMKEIVENLNTFSSRIARDPSSLLWRRRN